MFRFLREETWMRHKLNEAGVSGESSGADRVRRGAMAACDARNLLCLWVTTCVIAGTGAGLGSRLRASHALEATPWEDGNGWREGFGPQTLSAFDGTVRTMCFRGDDLLVGGDFTKAGGKDVGHVVRWTGVGWVPFSDGPDGSVRALVAHNGCILAGGSFESAASKPSGPLSEWCDGTWWGVGPWDVFDLSDYVGAFVVHENEVVVGGRFGAPVDSCSCEREHDN